MAADQAPVPEDIAFVPAVGQTFPINQGFLVLPRIAPNAGLQWSEGRITV